MRMTEHEAKKLLWLMLTSNSTMS